ncbi:MAG: GspH/FimT family pseudopilin [Alteromonadaceae bacterium]|nr:GspH/FimT family pseudopilin [Alteromonadaceae bacterium]
MRQTGYTLIELMITIAVLSIVVGIVVPGARGFINHSLLSKEVNEISALSRLARFSAMEEQTNIVLCPTTNYAQCGTDWTQGKMAFVDLNGNGDRSTNETIIGATEALHSSVSVTAPGQSILFNRRGGANVTTTLIFCDETSDADKAMGLIINGYGKIAVAQDRNNDGTKEDHAGNALTCA